MKEKTEKKVTGLTRLMQIAGNKKWWLFASIFLGVFSTVAQFTPYVSVFFIIDELSEHAMNLSLIDQSYVIMWGWIALGGIAVYGILFYCSNILSHIAAFNLLYEIRMKLSEKLYHFSMGYFSKSTSGKIKKVMSEDVERIELFVAHHIPDLSNAILFPILMIALLFTINRQLAIFATIPFPLSIIVQYIFFSSPKSRADTKKYHNTLENINTSVVEYLRGMPVVKVFGRSFDSFESLKNNIYGHRDNCLEMTKNWSFSFPAFLVLLSSSLIFILPAATVMLAKAPSYAEFLPVVLLFLVVGAGMFFPLLKLMWISGLLNQITIGVDRVDEILSAPEIKENHLDLVPADNSIEFRNVHFAYDKQKVLNDISFRVTPGTITALVGPSGAGKTTVAYLAARFWDINEGEILIGGVNIKDIKVEKLMDKISFVFQEGFLFYDSIEENIRMGKSEATREEVIAAAKAAQCHDFIEELPQGYSTLVGEGGVYLSGGEKQRISLARAILKDSPIILLDEATAFNDPENEGKILSSFSELIKDKTVIVIAHRLSTITNSDNILVIDNGEICESGTHTNLLKQNGLYAGMWENYTKSREWIITAKGVNECK